MICDSRHSSEYPTHGKSQATGCSIGRWRQGGKLSLADGASPQRAKGTSCNTPTGGFWIPFQCSEFEVLLPVREGHNPISLEFISLSRHLNFENRSESGESRTRREIGHSENISRAVPGQRVSHYARYRFRIGRWSAGSDFDENGRRSVSVSFTRLQDKPSEQLAAKVAELNGGQGELDARRDRTAASNGRW
jgi:hypothetical protein